MVTDQRFAEILQEYGFGADQISFLKYCLKTELMGEDFLRRIAIVMAPLAKEIQT